MRRTSSSRVRAALGTAAAAALLTAAAVPSVFAAAPPQTAVTKKPPATKGTAQLPGDVGHLGVTYTLGSGDDAFNLTINKAYLVASRMLLNGKTIAPEPGQKFLVLEYTIQNPNAHAEKEVYSQTFRMTVVDANNQNHELEGDAENTDTHQNLDIPLKPGQKVSGKQYIVVPDEMLVPKMILAWGDGSKVMRFDLHGVVGKVEPILLDPADTTGTIARNEIPDAKIGATYPSRFFDVTVASIGFLDGGLGDTTPDDGKRFLVVTLKAKNVSNKEDFDFNNGNGFTAYVMDADGDKIDWQGTWFKASSAEQADTNVSPGIEKTFRLLFPVPKSGGLKTLTLFQGENYLKLNYDLSALH